MLKESQKDDVKRLTQIAQTIIGRIISAARNLKIYPASHPLIKRLITESFKKLKEALKDSDYFSLSLAGNVLLINDKPAQVTNKQIVDKFLTTLGKRKIGKITFVKNIDIDDFVSLISILGLEPEDIEKRGGLKRVVSEKKLRYISISGISFGETKERKDTGIEWKELLGLIGRSDEFIKRIEKNPEEFSRVMEKTLAGKGGEGEEGEEGGWGLKVKQAIGNIAERLFNSYGEANIDAYTETVSKVILVLTPEMQSEILFSKPKIPFWEDVLNNVVDKIAAEELGDLVAKEVKKSSETMVITGEEDEAGGSKLSNIDFFLSNFIDKSKRKGELIPSIRKSFMKHGVKQSMLEYMSGGETRKELLDVIETDLMKSNIDAKTLLGIKTLIQRNANIEELIKSLFELLNNKDTEVRRKTVKSLVDLMDKLLILGRMDLIKLIIVAFSDRLGKESDTTIFSAIVKALTTIALRLIKEKKGISAEIIDDILNNYLKTLEEEEKLKIVVSALSNIGDEKALKHMIYAINRDNAFNLINIEIPKKGKTVFPLLLHSLKTIADRITRVRILSLLIDTAKNVPDFDKFIKTYLDDPKWYVRRNLAIILGEIGGNKSLDLLSKLVKDKEPRVRVEVMESLGKIKTDDSEILLLEGLKDADKTVVKRALTSLRKVGTVMSVFALKELLEKQTLLKKEEVLEIQERVISVLCSIGGNDAEDILRKVIFDKNIFGRYKYADKIRSLSVEGLGKMGTESSMQILTRVSWLKNQEVGKRAAEILKRIKIL